MISARSLCLAAALALPALCGCGSTSGGLFPLVNVNRQNEQPVTDVEVLSPLFRYREEPEETSAVFSPLFHYSHRPTQDLTKFQVLWPLFQYRRQKNDAFMYLFPITYYNRHEHTTGALDVDWALLPLIFGGRTTPADPQADPSPDQGDYLFVFPFGGTLKGLLGKTHITMYSLFYYEAEDMYGYQTRYAPFPFIGWGFGNGKKNLAFWPFYSWTEKRQRSAGPITRRTRALKRPGEASRDEADPPDESSGDPNAEGPLKYVRRSFLWPLGAYQQNALDTAHPETLLAFYPLFMRRWSDVRHDLWLLWPLFEWHRDDRATVDEDGNDFTVQRRGWSVLWPLFGADSGFSMQGDELYETRVLPFYWNKKDALKESTWMLFPFYNRTRYSGQDEYGAFENDNQGLYPLTWWADRRYADGKHDSFRYKLYPLVGYRRVRDRFTHVEFPSPIPVVLNEDFDRNWGFLWRLFEYRFEAERERSLRLLGPIFHYRKTLESTEFHFLPLFSHREDAETGGSRSDFLWGLLGGGIDQEKTYLRLLWFFEIPVGPGVKMSADQHTDRRRRRLEELGGRKTTASPLFEDHDAKWNLRPGGDKR